MFDTYSFPIVMLLQIWLIEYSIFSLPHFYFRAIHINVCHKDVISDNNQMRLILNKQADKLLGNKYVEPIIVV